MPRHTTVFLVEYRARGYDREDENVFREELEPLGAVRLRPLHLPEAGGVYEFWLAVEFVGLSIMSGLVAHAASGYYDDLAARLRRFVRQKKHRTGREPEMELCLSFDDATLQFTGVTEEILNTLPELGQRVYEHLSSKPLSRHAVSRVVPGMFQFEGQWYEPTIWGGNTDLRYWGISVEGHRALTHIYDSVTRLLSAHER